MRTTGRFWARRCGCCGPAFPDAQAVVAVAPGVRRADLEGYFPAGDAVRFVEGGTYDAIAAADVAIVSSGTATVEAALLGKPMIVIYRLSPMTARLAKPLVRTKFFSMVNLIAGRAVVPELIQDDFTAERVASESGSLLSASKERCRETGRNAARAEGGNAAVRACWGGGEGCRRDCGRAAGGAKQREVRGLVSY